jgi:predicted nucleic acid-binding protein
MVLLDSSPVGLATNPRGDDESARCLEWMASLPNRGYDVCLPEIIDHEVRRELLRANKRAGIRRLNRLKSTVTYLPISTPVMLRAAELWAEVRRQGQPTADRHALDGDVILAAQGQLLAEESGEPVVVATGNVGHLSRFVDARHWSEIL